MKAQPAQVHRRKSYPVFVLFLVLGPIWAALEKDSKQENENEQKNENDSDEK